MPRRNDHSSMSDDDERQHGQHRHHHRGLDAVAEPGDGDLAGPVGDPGKAARRGPRARAGTGRPGSSGLIFPSGRARAPRTAAKLRAAASACLPRLGLGDPALRRRARGVRQLGEIGERAVDVVMRGVDLDARQHVGRRVALRRVDRADAHDLAGIGLQAFEEAGRRACARRRPSAAPASARAVRAPARPCSAGRWRRMARAAPAPCHRRRAISPARARLDRAAPLATASRKAAALKASRAGLVGGRRLLAICVARRLQRLLERASRCFCKASSWPGSTAVEACLAACCTLSRRSATAFSAAAARCCACVRLGGDVVAALVERGRADAERRSWRCRRR